MAIRNIRRSGVRTTLSDITEDAFGTPPQARGSMNVLTGGEGDDDLEPGEELLTDEGDGMDVMDKPLYPEGRVVRVRLGNLRQLLSKALRG